MYQTLTFTTLLTNLANKKLILFFPRKRATWDNLHEMSIFFLFYFFFFFFAGGGGGGAWGTGDKKNIFQIYLNMSSAEILPRMLNVLCAVNIHHQNRRSALPTRLHVRPAKTRVSLSIRTGFSRSLLSSWTHFRSLTTNRVRCKNCSHCADAQADLRIRWAHIQSCKLTKSNPSEIILDPPLFSFLLRYTCCMWSTRCNVLCYFLLVISCLMSQFFYFLPQFKYF